MKRVSVWRVTVLIAAIGLTIGLGAQMSFATKGSPVHKVTICHRTDSVTNPYVRITVDYSGADGSLVHDGGNGDHTNHVGPVPISKDIAQGLKDHHVKWGDIIPPFSWPGDKTHPAGSYPGLNWGPEGQSVYNNGCAYPAPVVPPTPTPTPTPSCTVNCDHPKPTPTPTTEGITKYPTVPAVRYVRTPPIAMTGSSFSMKQLLFFIALAIELLLLGFELRRVAAKATK